MPSQTNTLKSRVSSALSLNLNLGQFPARGHRICRMTELTVLVLVVLSLLLQSEVTEGQPRVEGRKVHVFQGRGKDVLSSLKCEHHSQGYIVPDPYHCDRCESCLCEPSSSSLHVVPSGSWSADQMEDERFGCVKILRRVSTWSRASAGGGRRSTA